MDVSLIWPHRHSLFLLLFVLVSSASANSVVDDLTPLWIVLGILAVLLATAGVFLFIYFYRRQVRIEKELKLTSRQDHTVVAQVNPNSSFYDRTSRTEIRAVPPRYAETQKYHWSEASFNKHHSGGIMKYPFNETMSEYSHAAAHDSPSAYPPVYIKSSQPVTSGHLIWDGAEARKIGSRPSRYYDPVVSPSSGPHVFDYGAFHRPLVTGQGKLRRSNSFTYDTASRPGVTLRSYHHGYIRTQRPYSDRYELVPLHVATSYGSLPYYSNTYNLYHHNNRPHSVGDNLDSSQLLDTTIYYSHGEPVQMTHAASPRTARRATQQSDNAEAASVDPTLYQSNTYSYPM